MGPQLPCALFDDVSGLVPASAATGEMSRSGDRLWMEVVEKRL